MESGAARRIRGKAPGGGPKKRPVKSGRDKGYNFPALLLVSLLVHGLFLYAFDVLPKLFGGGKKDVKVYTITMAALPKGPAGGGGESREAVKPPPKPEKKPPEPDKEAVKVAEKTKKKPEPAPVKEKKPKPAVKPDTQAPAAKKPTVGRDAPVGPGQGPIGGGKEGDFTGPVSPVEGIPFPYPEYIRVIERKVSGNWRPPELGTRRKPRVVLTFRIDRKGRVSDIVVEESSGVGLVDRSAMSAVKDSSPIEGFPQAFEGDGLRVRYNFIVGDRK